MAGELQRMAELLEQSRFREEILKQEKNEIKADLEALAHPTASMPRIETDAAAAILLVRHFPEITD
jgi:hypothetical protein